MNENLSCFEDDIENYSSLPLSNNSKPDLKDLFFNEIYPIFIKNLRLFVSFKESENKSKDLITLKSIPFLVKLTTKNMILYLLMLTNYKTIILEMVQKIQNIYIREMNFLFQNINFGFLFINIDKELSTNYMVELPKSSNKFTNLKRVYEGFFKHLNDTFDKNKFNDIFSSITDLSEKIRSMINPKVSLNRDVREHLKLNEDDLDDTGWIYYQNTNEQDDLNISNLYNMIVSPSIFANGSSEKRDSNEIKGKRKRKRDSDSSSDSDSGMRASGPKSPLSKRLDSSSESESNSESDTEHDFKNEADFKNVTDSSSESESESESDSDSFNRNSLYKESFSEKRNPKVVTPNFDFSTTSQERINISFLFENLKEKLNYLQEINNINPKTSESISSFDLVWVEIQKIYDKFDKILEKLIKDTNLIAGDFFSPYEVNADVLKFIKKSDEENLKKYLQLDKKIDESTASILNSLPFQTLVKSHIKNVDLSIRDYLKQYEFFEKKLISNNVVIASIARLQLHTIKRSNNQFPIINFLPKDLLEPFFFLIRNFNIDQMYRFISDDLENKNLFVSLCGFVLTPIEKLILICEKNDTKIFDNNNMINKMDVSYKDSVKNLFKFMDMFILQMRKHNSSSNLNKVLYYYNIKNDHTKSFDSTPSVIDTYQKKEISSNSSDYDKHTFSYETCVSALYHNSVANMFQFKQALLLVQTFFGMIEPIFIFSCIFKFNSLYIKQILTYLSNQNTYKISSNNPKIREEDNEEIPTLTESFLIRFLFFYSFLYNTINFKLTNNDQINLELNDPFLLDLFKKLITKKRIINKLKTFGILINNYGNDIILDCKIKSDDSNNEEKTFTVNEEYFVKCQDKSSEIPNVLQHLTSANLNVFKNKIELKKLFKANTTTNILTVTDSLRILQQMNQSLFGGIVIQSIKMIDFNYDFDNLYFKENNILLKITH